MGFLIANLRDIVSYLDVTGLFHARMKKKGCLICLWMRDIYNLI